MKIIPILRSNGAQKSVAVSEVKNSEQNYMRLEPAAAECPVTIRHGGQSQLAYVRHTALPKVCEF